MSAVLAHAKHCRRAVPTILSVGEERYAVASMLTPAIYGYSYQRQRRVLEPSEPPPPGYAPVPSGKKRKTFMIYREGFL